MLEKDLRKLNRTELLEIMLEQQGEIDRLRKELEDVRKQLDDRAILLGEAGSIAEASLRINHIFAVAQKAADDYLAGVRASAERGILYKRN